ncbi:hypothetical protein X777_16342 [Ooceraea biroi]|uniref:Uncharacterized protein n=1 Tax=Ooceraea biroi TaxID=2015173 RepID=A0A026VU19_OOCBI|nr:hypothetical protein X777_16342 [Ooceraea biroi]
MALPLINQPASDSIKDLGRSGTGTRGRNLLILFPESPHRPGRCRLGGFDTRPSRAVIKPRPDSYLNGQLSLDLDGRKEHRLLRVTGIKAADQTRPGSRLRQPLSRPSVILIDQHRPPLVRYLGLPWRLCSQKVQQILQS